jgi:hypothetical protein
MSIAMTCPNSLCGKSLRAKDELAGKRARCPKCGGSIVIPEQARAPAALAVAEIARVHTCGASECPPLRLSDSDVDRLPVGWSKEGTAPRKSLPHDPALVKRFRLAAHILGGATIGLGTLTLAVIPIFLLHEPPRGINRELLPLLVGIEAIGAVAWIVCGIFTCAKSLGAVHAIRGLAMLKLGISVLNMISGVPFVSVGGLIALGLLGQAKRTLELAKQLKSNGIALNAAAE